MSVITCKPATNIMTVHLTNREILRITPDGTVIAHSLEDASEAGRVFVESMRGHLDVIRDAIRSELAESHTQKLSAVQSELDAARAVLAEAVASYGKPGGPWNVPSDPGGWLERARAALGPRP